MNSTHALRSYPERMAILVIVAIQFFMAVVGNAMVCYVIVTEKKLKKCSMITIFNLAVTDICYPLVAIIPFMAVMVTDKWVLGDIACKVCGYIVQVLALASIENMTVIAFTRYIVVCHRDFANRYLTKTYYVLTTVMTWVLPSAINLQATLGWGTIEFNYKLAICMHDWHSSLTYAVFVVILAFFIPLTLIIILYAKTFYTVWKSGRTVRSSVDGGGMVLNNSDIKLAKVTFCIFSSFVICWMPLSTFIYIDLAYPLGPELLVCSMVFIFCNGVSNPIVYSLVGEDFRSAFKKLFTVKQTLNHRAQNSVTL